MLKVAQLPSAGVEIRIWVALTAEFVLLTTNLHHCPSHGGSLPPHASRPGKAAWKRCHLTSAWEDRRVSSPSSRGISHLPQGDSSRIKGSGDIKRKLIKNSSLSSNCIIKSIESTNANWTVGMNGLNSWNGGTRSETHHPLRHARKKWAGWQRALRFGGHFQTIDYQGPRSPNPAQSYSPSDSRRQRCARRFLSFGTF